MVVGNSSFLRRRERSSEEGGREEEIGEAKETLKRVFDTDQAVDQASTEAWLRSSDASPPMTFHLFERIGKSYIPRTGF